MKKVVLASLLLAATGVFTSCMESSGNDVTGSSFGVVEIKTSQKVIYVSDSECVYASNLASDQNINPGDCCYFGYNIDFDAAENKDAKTKGYYTVTGTQYVPLDKQPISSYIMDTATVMTNEVKVSNIDLTNWAFIKSHLFITAYFNEVKTGLERSYNLSYDPNAEPKIVDDGNGGTIRVYDLYLRVLADNEGKSSTINDYATAVFDMSEFSSYVDRIEKATDAKYVNFVIHYVSAIDEDSTMEWKETATLSYVLNQ
ncbi:MAG: hypothetical protein M0P33_04540 [Massilibacteroides sp.]|nr:hypothetical protein [Massilibacteroides sp.]